MTPILSDVINNEWSFKIFDGVIVELWIIAMKINSKTFAISWIREINVERWTFVILLLIRVDILTIRAITSKRAKLAIVRDAAVPK